MGKNPHCWGSVLFGFFAVTKNKGSNVLCLRFGSVWILKRLIVGFKLTLLFKNLQFNHCAVFNKLMPKNCELCDNSAISVFRRYACCISVTGRSRARMLGWETLKNYPLQTLSNNSNTAISWALPYLEPDHLSFSLLSLCNHITNFNMYWLLLYFGFVLTFSFYTQRRL